MTNLDKYNNSLKERGQFIDFITFYLTYKHLYKLTNSYDDLNRIIDAYYGIDSEQLKKEHENEH